MTESGRIPTPAEHDRQIAGIIARAAHTRRVYRHAA